MLESPRIANGSQLADVMERFMLPASALSIACGVVVCSCGGASDVEVATVTVTDSAGVEIVVSEANFGIGALS